MHNAFHWFVGFTLICCLSADLQAQGGLSFDLKKPKKYEDKKLGSEKSADKKFGLVRRFTQNGVTKFNWHFNANTRLEQVIARAKASHKDNYTTLLSFYNYDLNNMEALHGELDSVIYKANAGILIHDLRNAWVDNLYMLMGMAHYFKNDLDTAYLTFQYINYAFAPKEKDGYDKPIGSNATEGGNVFSVSTPEKKGIVQKVWTRPPNRNEALIWQIRTYITKNELAEAGGLIETLRADPLFPDRLRTDLHEMQAYYFYKQQAYDSAAYYLDLALPNAENNAERARWEYLIAQLYERSDHPLAAREYFERSAGRTFDPVMEIYARLNAIRQNREDEKTIEANINALLKMARRDRYMQYRDIIYYTAASMELERKNVEGARQLLLKATQVPPVAGDNGQRTQAFLLLGDLSFEIRKFKDAKRFYDSVDITDPGLADAPGLQRRKLQLLPIVAELDIVSRQDSLQRIAALPEKEREAYVKKLLKQLNKGKNIKEESGEGAGANSVNKTNAPPDLFGNAGNEWYFDNASLKARGFTDFKAKWGNRPNTDNWRRSSAISRTAAGPGETGVVTTADSATVASPDSVLSFEGLMKNLPLSEEMLKISNDSLEEASFNLGKMYFESLEDYEFTITTLEELLTRYPATIHNPEALFILHYCYSKMGNTAKADEAKKALEQQFEGSEYQKLVSNPAGGSEKSNADADMNRRYDKIYNSFIEGRFDEALDEKKLTDSLYGTHYWTPQLLYIQSVFFIKQRDDEQAKKVLQQIIQMFPDSELHPRAVTLLDVLGRRKEIEEYLTNLQIERPADDSAVVINEDSGQMPEQVSAEDSLAAKLAGKPVRTPATDSVNKANPTTVVPGQSGLEADMLAAGKARADSLAVVNRAREAAARKALDSLAEVQRLQDLAAAKTADSLVLVNRADSITAIRRADSLGVVAGQRMRDSLQASAITRDSLAIVTKRQSDSLRKAAAMSALKSAYTPNDAAPHLVLMVLDRVDPVYVGEARNAFDRYNRQTFFNVPMTTANMPLTDSLNLVVISPFADAASALDYTRKTAAIADTRIIPWMPKGKFSFIVITAANLELLKTRRDLSEYLMFHGEAYSGK